MSSNQDKSSLSNVLSCHIWVKIQSYPCKSNGSKLFSLYLKIKKIVLRKNIYSHADLINNHYKLGNNYTKLWFLLDDFFTFFGLIA